MTKQRFYFENRWCEILKNLREQHRAIPNFSYFAKYALVIPGSSAEVERLFSIIKEVWGPKKGQMNLNTLESHS
jgi:hypothetical protein